MHLAIALIGQSYGKLNLHYRDWNLSKDNLKKNLIDCFNDQASVSVYTATYENSQVSQITDFYKPKKCLVLPFEGSSQKVTYLRCMQLLLDQEVDFIMSTRFDMFFHEPLTNAKIDRNKMNFVFREKEPHWSEDRFVGDCFFAFPKKYLETFIYCIEDMIRHDQTWPKGWYMHGGIYRNMVEKVGAENINFILDGCHDSSKENDLYKLIRCESLNA
jgi:hypothetical protein